MNPGAKTGVIRCRPATEEYREGWERIFGARSLPGDNAVSNSGICSRTIGKSDTVRAGVEAAAEILENHCSEDKNK